MKISLVALPALLALSSVCLGQTGPSIVNNDAAPARIVSTTEKPSDMLSAVTIGNKTDRTIKSVTIGVIVTVPQSCGVTSYLGRERAHAHAVDLSPDSKTTLTDLHMSYIGIRRLLKRLQAKDIVAQIAVVGVTYEDGEKWSLTRSGKTYNDETHKALTKLRCGDGGGFSRYEPS